ncbi:MAG: ATP-binding protein [Candidatus Rokuibacteriota bacterium]
MARDLTERARAAGVRVATGRAVEGASQFSFRPFGEALLAVVREHGPPGDPDLVPFHGVLSAFVPAWAREESRPAEPSLVLLEGIHRLLRALSKQHGLLLVLEDLHWADVDTLGAVEYLADNLSSERLLCLCTERSGFQGRASDVLARLVSRRAASRIHLAPLTEMDVEAMARASLAVDTVPGAVLSAVRRRAEGVPFLIEEMLSAYVAAGGKPEGGAEWWLAGRVADSLPSSFRDLVAERLGSLNDQARAAVTAAAILGRTFEWPLVEVIVDLPRDSVTEGLRVAVDVQLLAGAGGTGAYAFSFRHALMREAVLAEMLPPERAELAFRAAEAIEDHRPGVACGFEDLYAPDFGLYGDPRAEALIVRAAGHVVGNNAKASFGGYLSAGENPDAVLGSGLTNPAGAEVMLECPGSRHEGSRERPEPDPHVRDRARLVQPGVLRPSAGRVLRVAGHVS